MTERERFEAWINAPPYRLSVARYHEDDGHPWAGRYIGPSVQLAWEAWQRSTSMDPDNG